MTTAKTAKIWVPLRGDSITWVQVDAEVVGESTFRVVGPEPEGQAWEYGPNSVVRCVIMILLDMRTRGLFAVERILH